MIFFIILLMIIALVIIFRKNIVSVLKYIFSKKRNLIFLIVITTVIIITSIIFIYKKENQNDVDEALRKTVENYIYQTYSIECKVKKSSYNYNDYGNTGGMFFYYFTLKDKKGKTYLASYSGYGDLNESKLNKLNFKEE